MDDCDWVGRGALLNEVVRSPSSSDGPPTSGQPPIPRTLGYFPLTPTLGPKGYFCLL